MKVEDGAYVVTKARPVSHLDKFTVTATIDGVSSKAVSLKVKMGSAKITQSVKSVTLLKTDRFSRGTVTLTPTDSALRISKVELDSASTTRFSLTPLGGGAYAIGYAGNTLSGTKTAKVKLRVFLEGNLTGTPNATVTVTVTIK